MRIREPSLSDRVLEEEGGEEASNSTTSVSTLQDSAGRQTSLLPLRQKYRSRYVWTASNVRSCLSGWNSSSTVICSSSPSPHPYTDLSEGLPSGVILPQEECTEMDIHHARESSCDSTDSFQSAVQEQIQTVDVGTQTDEVKESLCSVM